MVGCFADSCDFDVSMIGGEFRIFLLHHLGWSEGISSCSAVLSSFVLIIKFKEIIEEEF